MEGLASDGARSLKRPGRLWPEPKNIRPRIRPHAPPGGRFSAKGRAPQWWTPDRWSPHALSQRWAATQASLPRPRSATTTAHTGTGTTEPAWPSRSMQLVARLLSTEHKLMSDAEGFARAYQGRPEPAPAPIPRALRLIADISSRTVLGRTVYTLVPHRHPAPDDGLPIETTPVAGPSPWHIVYLHGGGFVNSVIGPHWDIVTQLIRHTGATVTVPLYPLAPTHTYKEGLAFVEAVYRELAASSPPERIVLAGDSAGGAIAIVTSMRMRDDGGPSPARLVLFSPCTSVVEGSENVDEIERVDPILDRIGGMLAGTWWAGNDDPANPEVSPLFGDLSGLPPMQIFQGTRDILMPDVKLFARGVEEAGGDVELRMYPGAIHVFVGATFTPEAQDTFRAVAAALHANAPAYARLQRVATSHVGLLPRQVAARATADGTPWIRHGRRVADAWQRAVGSRRPVRLAGL